MTLKVIELMTKMCVAIVCYHLVAIARMKLCLFLVVANLPLSRGQKLTILPGDLTAPLKCFFTTQVSYWQVL